MNPTVLPPTTQSAPSRSDFPVTSDTVTTEPPAPRRLAESLPLEGRAEMPGSTVRREAVPNEYTRAGQAAYTPLVLKVFDLYAYRLAMHAETREAIADLYDRNVRSPHLEAGAGTSYSLANSRALRPGIDLVLSDLNPNCLATSGKRLAPYYPTLLRADVLKPVPVGDGRKFASIGLSYVVSVLPHHIPGGKWQVFDHLAQALTDDGVLFGVVSPGKGVQRSLAARVRFWLYNRMGILDNEHDSLQDVERALGRNFRQVDIRVIHGEILFEARTPRTDAVRSGESNA